MEKYPAFFISGRKKLAIFDSGCDAVLFDGDEAWRFVDSGEFEACDVLREFYVTYNAVDEAPFISICLAMGFPEDDDEWLSDHEREATPEECCEYFLAQVRRGVAPRLVSLRYRNSK